VNVYRVEFDSLVYQSLYPVKDDLLWSDAFQFDGTAKRNSWKSPEVFSLRPWRLRPDLWNLESVAGIVFSVELTNELRPILEAAGELLPIRYGLESLSLLNVIASVDYLQPGVPGPKTGQQPGEGTSRRYSFDLARMPESSIFKIPETAETEILCSVGIRDPDREFKPVVERLGLKGLVFREVWPEEVERGPVDPSVAPQVQLTRHDVAAAPANQVDRLVFEALVERISALDDDGEHELVNQLSPGQKMVWATDIVDGEIQNGGFNQVFWNHADRYAQEAIEGFRLIGAEEHAALVQEGLVLFEKEWHKLEPFYAARTLKAFSESYAHTESDGLDKRWSKLPDFRAKRTAYIRRHLDEFVLE
jgi:hypothetical protein